MLLAYRSHWSAHHRTLGWLGSWLGSWLGALTVLVALSTFVPACKKGQPVTISDPVAGATLVLPSGFSAGSIPGADPNVSAAFRVMGYHRMKDIGVGVVTESKVDMADVMQLEGYVRVINDKRKTLLREFRVSQETVGTCAGYPCVTQEFTAKSDNMRIAYRVSFVETPKNFHQVLTWTTPSRLKSNLPDIEKVHASFREEPR